MIHLSIYLKIGLLIDLQRQSEVVERMSAARDAMSYVDPDTGYTMLPGTQRPDGTWRKPRRYLPLQ